MRISLRDILAIATALLLAGCHSAAPPALAPMANDEDGHAETHDHSHEELGPHGGHLLELGDEEYHFEWTHDDAAGLVTLYLLDGAAKQLVPVPAQTITITAKVSEPTEYQLIAVDPSGEPPASAKFELKSPELIECLRLAGQGTEVSVAVMIDGQKYSGKFEHHDHGHDHHH